MNKDITFQPEAHEKLKAGVDKIANVVKATLGPGGANVILQRGDTQAITKDGVSVAREVYLTDPIENIGAQIVKEAAERTVQAAGDGTTTATVLAQAIYTEGLKAVQQGAKLIDVKRGIDIATVAVVEELKRMTRKVDNNDLIAQIARVSSNGDSAIASIVTDAMIDVGLEGIVTVDDSKTQDTYRERVEGMQWNRGYMSHAFVNRHHKQDCYLENPVVLVFDGNIATFREITGRDPQNKYNIIDRWRSDPKVGNLPLLVVCLDAGADFIATMAHNVHRQAFQGCVVQCPEFGDTRKAVLADIAAMTGATVISTEKGMKWSDVKVEHLGHCEAARITNWTTTIIGGKGGLMATNRMAEIRQQIEEDPNEHAVASLKARLARLKNGVNVIYVGGASIVEIQEKKDRIDDALNATRAAMEEGILPGGGVAYLRACSALSSLILPNSDQEKGRAIIYEALAVPIKAIAENVGENGQEVLTTVALGKDDYGFNAATQVYEPLYEAGVIDPLKVTRLALQNAASVAGMLLTTKAIVSNEKPRQQ